MIVIALDIHEQLSPILSCSPVHSKSHAECGKDRPEHQLKALEESCLLFPQGWLLSLCLI